jgi:hypothetical protein
MRFSDLVSSELASYLLRTSYVFTMHQSTSPRRLGIQRVVVVPLYAGTVLTGSKYRSITSSVDT